MTMRMTIPRLRLVTAFAIVAAISIFGLFAHNGPLSVSAQADTTAPTFVSATTSRDGIEVMVTFSEDIAVSPLVSTLAKKYGVTQGMILKDLMTVTVDGRDNVLISSSYSGPVLTLRLENPQARTGQVVKVAYNNIFAQEPGGVLTDSAYNAVELFDFQSVTNASVDDSASTFIDQPVLDKSTLTLCEGQDGTYGVSLPSQPPGNVGIGTLFTPWDIVYPSPEYLSFTQDNWDTDQTITILTDVDDDDYTNWAMVYNRISGVHVTQTYDKVIRVLVLEENHADCSQVGEETEAENTPATGAPAITGTPQPGEVLTADTSGMSDADGMEGATFTYQWVRNDGSTDTGITGATGSTYTVVEDDVGNEIKVRVSFTDDADFEETVTSYTVYVQPPQPLYGGLKDGPVSHDGSTAFMLELYFSEDISIGYEAVRDDVLDVTGGSVTNVRRLDPNGDNPNMRWEITVEPDGNDEVTLVLPITTDCGDQGAVCTSSEKMLSNKSRVTIAGPPETAQQVQPENSPATSAPTVTGTARVGETLTADTSGIADADGLQNATFSFQWVAGGSDISGATGSTYTLTASDQGQTVQVRVSFTDDAGNEETLTSAATAAVAATFPGTPRSLQVQTAGTGELEATWQQPESNGGSDVTGYRVQWKLATGSWDTEADVSSATATGTSHTITSLSLDTEYAVRVIATNSAGDGPPSAEQRETAVAQASEQREESTANTAATGAPAISGTAQAGETLTADTSDIADENGLDNASFSYQWVSYDGNADTNIPGATGSTYTLVPADEGRAFRVRVSFTDDDGHRESLTSALARSERPYALSASASDGAVALTWKLPVGWPYSSTFQILRNRPELGEAEPLVLVKYLQAPGNAHTDTDVEAGVLYVYRVEGVDPFGYTGEASHPFEIRVEAAPADNNPASGAPTISGTAQVGETLTADTSGIADEDGLDNAAFDYQWLADDAEIEDATASTYTLAAADEGKTIKVKVSFTDDNSNDESLTSAATGAVAAAPPTNNEATGAPAISGTVKVGHVLTADITGIADPDGLDNADFDYQWLAEDSPIPAATGSAYLLVAADKGRAITVKVSFTDDGDSDESLTSAATAAVTTSPLTVGLENEPADHDGQNTFTFQLRFSEEFQVSYLTLRDDAFTVDGGEVTKARRLESDSITPNVRWEITVRPAGDGDVTITLPETTDCDAAGAICTEDGRMLSNRLEPTVRGPGG